MGEGSALAEIGDDDLMLLTRQDRRDAFEVLVARHTSLVLATAARFFGDRGRGREAAQDVFLMLWSERERYQPRGKLTALLVTMTFNRCRALARQHKSEKRKSDRLQLLDVNSDPGTPLDRLIEESRTAHVRQELAALPEPVREIMILRYTQEMSIKEIATVTGKPEGTIKSHIFRGLKRLRDRVGRGEQP